MAMAEVALTHALNGKVFLNCSMSMRKREVVLKNEEGLAEPKWRKPINYRPCNRPDAPSPTQGSSRGHVSTYDNHHGDDTSFP
jgi:hypothetical protein